MLCAPKKLDPNVWDLPVPCETFFNIWAIWFLATCFIAFAVASIIMWIVIIRKSDNTLFNILANAVLVRKLNARMSRNQNFQKPKPPISRPIIRERIYDRPNCRRQLQAPCIETFGITTEV